MSGPFDLHIPSVFVVGSPFQALCAIAAIKNLEITDYFFLVVHNGAGSRDSQIDTFLNNMKVKYRVFYLNKYNLIKGICKNILGLEGAYERLFVGEFSASFMMGVGLPFIKRGSNVVYLDDGSAMISFLGGTFERWDKKSTRAIFNMLAKKRGIIPLRNFYTIYSDIQNSKYNIKGNDLSVIWNADISFKEQRNVVLIGTNMNSYCSQLELSSDDYIHNIKLLFEQINRKFPHEKIIYIPHGNDKSLYAQQLCEEYDGEFVKVETMVEEYLLRAPWIPVAVYGLCSTALLNVKRMMPSIQIVNVLIYGEEDSKYLGKYKSIFTYYQKNGIDCVEVYP